MHFYIAIIPEIVGCQNLYRHTHIREHTHTQNLSHLNSRNAADMRVKMWTPEKQKKKIGSWEVKWSWRGISKATSIGSWGKFFILKPAVDSKFKLIISNE